MTLSQTIIIVLELKSLNVLTKVNSHPQWTESPDPPSTKSEMTLNSHARTQTDTKTDVSTFLRRAGKCASDSRSQQLQMTDFPPAEQKQMNVLPGDTNCGESTRRRDEIAIVENQLRGFMDGKCMSLSASSFNWLTNPHSNKVVSIFSAWFIVSAPHHNIEVFISMGLIPVERDWPFFLRGCHRKNSKDLWIGRNLPTRCYGRFGCKQGSE
jgi:hypothetical protein